MRMTRALSFGFVMLIPGLFLGLLVWILVGRPEDNFSLTTIFACNLIPISSVLLGIFFGWKTGEEYAMQS